MEGATSRVSLGRKKLSRLGDSCRERDANLKMPMYRHDKGRSNVGPKHSAATYLVRAFSMLVGILVTTGAAQSCPSGEPLLEKVRSEISTLEGWLTSVGLGNRLEVIRVRCAPHPSQDATPSDAFRLESRWITNKPTRDEALAEFLEFNSQFARANGQGLGEKLFFRFIHDTGVHLDSSAAHIHVLGKDFATFMATNGRVITVDSALRMVVEDTHVSTNSFTSLPLTARPAQSKLVGVRRPDNALVVNMLTSRYGTNFRQQVSKLGFIEFKVENLRGVIVPNERFWERLQGTLTLVPEGDALLLRLHMDGRFAVGLGDRRPSDGEFQDMEPRYAERLTYYAKELLTELQTKFEESIR